MLLKVTLQTKLLSVKVIHNILDLRRDTENLETSLVAV